MSRWVFALLQFFPLSTFATYAFWYGTPTNQRWLEAFQLGALLGVIQLVILLPQSNALNRLVLAGNIYLIFGGFAVYSQQWWYLEMYNSLRESAIILIMAIVGLITTFTSSSGFIAIQGSARLLSVYLLAATILMLPIATYFEGERLYAAILPIIFLAILQRYLAFLANTKTIT